MSSHFNESHASEARIDRSSQLTATEAVSYSKTPLSGSFKGLSLILPAQDIPRTKGRIVWEGERTTDDLVKTILIKELKTRDEASIIDISEEDYFTKALVEYRHSWS